MSDLKALLVGCGGISKAWLTALKSVPGVGIAGLVDVRRESAQERAKEFGLTDRPTFADAAEALDAVKPDVLFNCTIPEAHVPITLAALERGVHVLTEKPLADSLDGGRKIVAAATASNRIVAVIQNRRYDPAIRRIRSFLSAGAIGRLGTVNADFYIGAHFGGFRDVMPHVLLLDMAIHTFDQCRCATGLDPVSVYAKEWNPPGSWYARDASAVAVFGMTGGAVFTYRGSWCAEGLNTSWESSWRFVGEKGTLIWNGGADAKAQIVSKPGGFHSEWKDLDVPPAAESGKDGGHAGNIAEFIRCVREGGIPETAAADNLKSLAMALGAIESSEAGTPIDLG